ncbi:dicarboxylate/amino acid:cation symporter [Oceanirhabdus sp. W0125-5]|uniref:dicarboxylate/amino acid:cation symporter n=1 Tax=Oceanirhabdus sp. W0125-5 TaxID=2999116 RepID=UPI0022F2B315|nr:dicarboxylate/amino acid:cation symporter [Oceanirhabdus sp. W0125-5]WBW97505.1 dicarboxylate/amino acid:cation symporter [Oceanirhabdus sp. W0125-5]
MKKSNLTLKILLAMFFGLVLGGILYNFNETSFVDKVIVNGVLDLLGGIFINSIKMMVVPLVFVSLVCGSAAIGDIKKLGRVGGKTVLFYITTTAIAISIAFGLASITNPGKGLILENLAKAEYKVGTADSFFNILKNIVSTNPIKSLAEGNMLQIIVFAILVGIGISVLGSKVEKVKNLFEELNVLVLKLVEIIMLFAPIGVFALITKTFATLGYGAMFNLGKYMLTVVFALIIHFTVTYLGMLTVLGRLNPFKFMRKFMKVITVAFSTASSNATIPVTLETVQDDLGVSKGISSFTIPLGATINMDGTAIMQGVATVFIAQIYNIPLDLGDFVTVVMTATLASIGTAGVPGVGLIMLSMVLTQIGVPVEGIALIIGIDRILDMCRTAINVTGDAVCTTIIAKTEGEFDNEVFENEVSKISQIA